MRNKEDRNGDIEKSMRHFADGELGESLHYIWKLLGEDPYEMIEHTLRAGRKDQERDDCQDFRVDRDDGKVVLRSVFVNEMGDTPEVGFARFGPDGAPFNHKMPEEVPPGTPMGLWYWRLWTRARGLHWRCAQLYARFCGNGNAGSLHFATSPGIGDTGQDGPPDKGLVDRLVIHPDGLWEYNGPEEGAGIPIVINGHKRILPWKEELRRENEALRSQLSAARGERDE